MTGGVVPTAEQDAIIAACRAGKRLVIEAGAGSGKTSTLKMAAAEMRGRGLYVAFNKAIATEAASSFPDTVTCKTAHSLAYGAVGRKYAHRLRGPRVPAKETARRLGITDRVDLGGGSGIDPTQLARVVMGTVDRYCRSAETTITPRHLASVNGLTHAERDALSRVVVPLAEAAWADIQDPNGGLRFAHDHYLKMWALTKPDLRADYVLFDEAQDANPVIAEIIQSQRDTQTIAVGDSNQSIYAWRGAVDALATWPADARLRLSQSFRFGPAIADEANVWLDELGSTLRLTGTPRIASEIRSLDAPDAILARTNGTAMSRVMTAMDAGRRVALVGGGQAIASLADAAADLKAARRTNHPELFMFETWGQVQDYVEHDDAGGDLAATVRLIDRHGPEAIAAAAARLSSEARAEVTVSTAHKAKGREWASVTIASDFHQPKPEEDGQPGPIPRADAMLAYVAITRARQTLDQIGLAWIHDHHAATTTEANPPTSGEPHPVPDPPRIDLSLDPAPTLTTCERPAHTSLTTKGGTTVTVASGETTTIGATRAYLTQLGTHIGTEILSQLELCKATLSNADMDPTTLGHLTTVTEHLTAAKTAATETVSTLNTQHGLMENAVQATPHAAKTDFYRE